MNSTISDWQECFSKSKNSVYWFNKLTGKSVWSNPNILLSQEDEDTSINEKKHQISEILTKRNISEISTNNTNILENSSGSQWIKKFSTKHQAPYWFNSFTLESRWSDPNNETDSLTIRDNELRIQKCIAAEKAKTSIAPSNFPKLIDNLDCKSLLERIRNEKPKESSKLPEFEHIFTLIDDYPSNFTRAIQEEEILKTRLKVKQSGGKTIDLPSFWEVWSSNPSLSREICTSSDPQEEKWKATKKFGYKMATTFMPGYAKAIFEYFNAKAVLDPCAGWGDRLTGAATASGVEKYVAFDPNRNLRPGYAKIMEYCGHCVTDLTEDKLTFSNNFEIHSLPFEIGVKALMDESFDMAFTSPPFFDYEMYNPKNPTYTNWEDQFYTPLFQEVCRCVKPNGFFGIHIGDTSAGAIMPFLMEKVHKISGFAYKFSIGLKGMVSNKMRTVYFFQKHSPKLLLPNTKLSSHGTGATLTKNQIKAYTNPRIQMQSITFDKKTFLLFDDSKCIGGTKQRLLGKLLEQVVEPEVIYAGPESGFAQVALAYTAYLWKKKATVFLNTYVGTHPRPPLVRLAEALGANIKYSDNPRGRSLQDTEAAAGAYVSEDTANRFILPFGLKTPKGEAPFDCFYAALSEAVGLLQLPNPPRRLWVVAGSAFLLDVLYHIWPSTHFMVVQVGRKIWPDLLENKKSTLFEAPERFGDNAIHQPPYHSVPWYDAKLWQFVMKHGEPGDCIWNVGAVPSDIDAVARAAKII